MPRNIRRLSLRVLRNGRVVLRRGSNAPRFAVELVRHPRTVGAICPSGTQLAGAMAAAIPEGKGLVIEIGAGTGAVTRAILARGIEPERLLVLERSPEFCRMLRRKFPGLNIVEGDAAMLASYVPEGREVVAVVSSLPLMNFPSSLREAILEQVRRVIGTRGCVIQFTYALLGESPYSRNGFRRDLCRFIPRNLPSGFSFTRVGLEAERRAFVLQEVLLCDSPFCCAGYVQRRCRKFHLKKTWGVLF